MPQHMQFHKFPPIWTGRNLSFYYIIKHRILSIFEYLFLLNSSLPATPLQQTKGCICLGSEVCKICSYGAFKLLLLLSRREIVLESEQYSIKKALCDFWSNVNFPLWFTSIHKENRKENLTVNQAATSSILSFPLGDPIWNWWGCTLSSHSGV